MMLEVQLLKEGLIAIFQVCNYFEKLTALKEEKSNLYPQIDRLREEMPWFEAEVLDLSLVSRGACWPFRSAVLESQGTADTLRQAVYTTDKKKSQKRNCENTILISYFF